MAWAIRLACTQSPTAWRRSTRPTSARWSPSSERLPPWTTTESTSSIRRSSPVWIWTHEDGPCLDPYRQTPRADGPRRGGEELLYTAGSSSVAARAGAKWAKGVTILQIHALFGQELCRNRRLVTPLAVEHDHLATKRLAAEQYVPRRQDVCAVAARQAGKIGPPFAEDVVLSGNGTGRDDDHVGAEGHDLVGCPRRTQPYVDAVPGNESLEVRNHVAELTPSRQQAVKASLAAKLSLPLVQFDLVPSASPRPTRLQDRPVRRRSRPHASRPWRAEAQKC